MSHGCGRQGSVCKGRGHASPVPCPQLHATPPSPVPLPGRGSSGLDLSALCIVSGKTCWVLYLDALLLNIGGNLHDALSVAAKVCVRRGAGALPRWQYDGVCLRWPAG